MAQPSPDTSAGTARVASCAATDCRHNESRTCTADEVRIEMTGGSPACGTYESEKPKPRP